MNLSTLGKGLRRSRVRKVEGNWKRQKGLSVKVSEVLYVPTLEAPPEKPYPFVYFVDVINDSEERVTIHGRKWVVRDHDGELMVLEGEGVVGQHPVIEAGDRFSYNSYHVVAGNGAAWGAFYGVSGSGKQILIPIPEFALEVPEWV